jgi:serine/threonine-protein kinase
VTDATNTAALDVTNLEPGTMLLGKYRIVRTLGMGGMGVVVQAQHVTLGSTVAMKFLLPQYVTVADAAQRFVREAQAASKIQSDHVAHVLDVGTLPEASDVPYMVMEYLEGQDLSRYVKSGHRFTPEEAIDYVIQAAEALAEAHREHIIHRDVKPANLFLTRHADGTPLVKVLDFGISKIAQEAQVADMGLTKTTAVLGSGYYMSPEQMRSAKNVDTRTDIYALGVCLYELLAGQPPFTADNFAELCLKVAMDPPTPLRQHRPDVPETLAEVIARAYARSPDERYPTMGAFVAALAPWASPHSYPAIEQVGRISAQMGDRVGMPSLPSLPPPGSMPPPPMPMIPGAAPVPSDSSGAVVAGGPLSKSVATPSGAPSQKGGTPMWLIAIAIAIVSGVGMFVGLGYVKAPPPAAGVPASTAPAVVTPPPASAAPSAAPTVTPVASAAEPAASASAEPAASASAAPSASAPAPALSALGKPKPAGGPKATPKAEGPCFGRDPDTGLRTMVPCPK